MADQAIALMLAEAATHHDESAMAVEDGDGIAGAPMGHIFKKKKKAVVEAGEKRFRVVAA